MVRPSPQNACPVVQLRPPRGENLRLSTCANFQGFLREYNRYVKHAVSSVTGNNCSNLLSKIFHNAALYFGFSNNKGGLGLLARMIT